MHRMHRLAAAIVIGLVFHGTAPAQEAGADTARAQQEGEHEVRKGDTLWDLAARYMEDPFSWEQIYEANEGKIDDPHWIYPGQLLLIPPGMRVAAPADAGREGAVEPRRSGEAPAMQKDTRRTVFASRSGEERQEGATLLRGEVRTRPVVPVYEHRSASWISGDAEAEPTYPGEIIEVVGSAESGKLPAAALPHFRVIVDYPMAEAPEIGDELLVVRTDRRVRGHGWIVQPTGILTVQRITDRGIVATVRQAYDRLRVGNGVLPVTDYDPVRDPTYEAVDDGIHGSIAALQASREMPQSRSEIYLTVGARDGVEIGDEFVVYDPEGPAEGDDTIALVRVLRVRETTATARLDHIYSPKVRAGMPVRLVRRVR